MYGPCAEAGRLGTGEAVSRNVRSVSDPLLPLLCNPGRSGALPFEETEPLLCIRLVCTWATGVGVVV